MSTYDINDPTDLDIMRGHFDMITVEEWDEYVEQATEMKMGYKNVNILKTAARKAGISKFLSPKVILWIMELVEKIDAYDEDDEYEEEDEDYEGE